MKSKKRIRLEDIARELNVSAVSVSNALRNKKGWGKISKQYQKYAGERAASLLPPSAGHRCYGGSEQRSGCLRGPGAFAVMAAMPIFCIIGFALIVWVNSLFLTVIFEKL